MSGYYGDFKAGQTVRIRFNTVGTTAAPTTLTSGAVTVSKDGSDVTPSGGVTLTTDVGGVTGRHHVVIDTSVDATTFTAGSDYAVRLSGSSAVGGVSVVGVVVGEWSIANRAAPPLSGLLGSPRALDSVADSAVTFADALWCAVAAAAGKETVSGTSYVVKTPYTGTVVRTFTLDSATAPTSRT